VVLNAGSLVASETVFQDALIAAGFSVTVIALTNNLVLHFPLGILQFG